MDSPTHLASAQIDREVLMRHWIGSHLTFANVVSLIALFVALGGTTYAATGGNFILGQSNGAGTPT